MRLTIKEIGSVNTKVLNTRFCELMHKGETLPANEISVAETMETLRIEQELHDRLINVVGHDFYPPDRIEIKYPSNYMISLLGSIKKKPEMKPGLKIKFHVVVTSSLGSKAAEFNIEADGKGQAEMLAQKKIRELGLKNARIKIS